jgi:ribosomal protein S18 acetylase RimI-like enzyme
MADPQPDRPAAVRPYRDDDLDRLVELCLRTNRRRYTDLDLLPDILVRPYLTAEPELAFVADDGSRVVGYVLGTADTGAFADWMADVWLPRVANRHPLPAGEPRTPQEHWTVLLHTPRDWLVRPELLGYPAHLHIDLLPAYRRQGLGRALMSAFLDNLHRRGVPAVHVSYVPTNPRAAAFYARMGFRPIDTPELANAVCAGRSTG